MNLHNFVLESISLGYRGALKAAFAKLDQRWTTYAKQFHRKDGSTAIVLMVINRMMIVANLGDSRVVLARDGKAVQLSNDHKPNKPSERVRIESLGGKVVLLHGIPRLQGVLATSRAIGNIHLKPILSAEPEVIQKELSHLDDFAVIATDGLWDVVRPQEAVNLVSRQRTVETAAQTLLDRALELGTSDNVTVMVVDVKAYYLGRQS